jgi:hypothetical protein
MRQFASTYKPTVTALMLGISLLVPCSRSSAQTLPDYLPTNGLVGWWPFNGNANDESGNGLRVWACVQLTYLKAAFLDFSESL